MTIQSEEDLKNAYKHLEKGNLIQARKILDNLVMDNLENAEVTFAIYCCSYWGDFVCHLPELDLFEQGDGILFKWKSFQKELQTEKKKTFERTLYHVQTGIFTLAYNVFSALENEKNVVQKGEILLNKGICCKKLGKYETALSYLTEAIKFSPSSANTLAEMADCYALCGMERQAKVLFREAFFVDAQKIDLAFLDSELICCLIRTVQEKGYVGNALQEWIPVYGVLLGIFNIRRELRGQEVGKLKQEIYAKENENKNPINDSNILTPKLINMYFWLIDHYVQTKDSGRKINEILLKIKIIDRDIYDLYIK